MCKYNILVILLLVPLVLSLHSIVKTVKTVMDSAATFTNVEECVGRRTWTVKKNDKYHRVTSCKDNNCTVEPRFQNRVKQHGTNFTINPVLFNDNGLYIYSCNDQEICFFSLHTKSRTSTDSITAGGSVTIRLCSLDQVKLNFTPMGRSAAETVFIVDNGKVFIDSEASGPMILFVQNNTAVLSGLNQSGMVTGLDSRTDTLLFEVNVTVTGRVDQSVWNGDICLPWWVYIIFCFVALIVCGTAFSWNKWSQRNVSNRPALALTPMLGDSYKKECQSNLKGTCEL